MQTWLAVALMGLMFQQPDAETRIIQYLQENLKPGVPVVVSDLANEVFTSPEEQLALSGLFNTFFKIPLFLIQYNTSTGEATVFYNSYYCLPVADIDKGNAISNRFR